MEHQPKEEPQAHAVTPRIALRKMNPNPMPRKVAREEAKKREASLSQDQRSGNSSAFPSLGEFAKKGDQCNYEHQIDNEGKPTPAGPEILQKHDEAVQRVNDNKAQAKAKSAPKGGVGVAASMIVLEPEEEEGDKVAAHPVKVPVFDECYATVDSGTNAVIVPLRPYMCSEIAECKSPVLPLKDLLCRYFSMVQINGWSLLCPDLQSLSLKSGSPLLQVGHLSQRPKME